MTIKELHSRLKEMGINVTLSDVDEFLGSRNIKIEEVTDSVVSAIAVDFQDMAGSALATAKGGKVSKASNSRATKGDRAKAKAATLQQSIAVVAEKTSQDIEAIVSVVEAGTQQYVKRTAERLINTLEDAPNQVLDEVARLAVGAQSDAESFREATESLFAGTCFALESDPA